MNVYTKWTGHKSLIENALTYLPYRKKRKVNEIVGTITTMHGNNGCCFHRTDKRIIYISEQIIPDDGIIENTLYYKWFICVVLHECAHAILNHKPTIIDSPENQRQEKQAHKLAVLWLNDREKSKGLTPTLCSELQEMDKETKNSRKKIREFINNSLRPLTRPE